jgi:hypothetical protein
VSRRLTLAQHRQHDTLINRILADGGMKPEEKLMAVVMRRSIDYGEPLKAHRLAELVFGAAQDARRYTHPYAQYDRLMREDIRRYDAFVQRLDELQGCPAQLPRAKRRCGRSGWLSAYLIDLETGEKHYVSYCSKHRKEGEEVINANRAAVKERIVPRPHANTGGRIAAHLPELDWVAYWRKLDPKWEPFPERVALPATPVLRPVPDLEDETPTAQTTATPAERDADDLAARRRAKMLKDARVTGPRRL